MGEEEARVWIVSPFKDKDLILHLALAAYIDANGNKVPELEFLSRRTRLSEAQIKNRIDKFKKLGYLKQRNKGYYLEWPARSSDLVPKSKPKPKLYDKDRPHSQTAREIIDRHVEKRRAKYGRYQYDFTALLRLSVKWLDGGWKDYEVEAIMDNAKSHTVGGWEYTWSLIDDGKINVVYPNGRTPSTSKAVEDVTRLRELESGNGESEGINKAQDHLKQLGL